MQEYCSPLNLQPWILWDSKRSEGLWRTDWQTVDFRTYPVLFFIPWPTKPTSTTNNHNPLLPRNGKKWVVGFSLLSRKKCVSRAKSGNGLLINIKYLNELPIYINKITANNKHCNSFNSRATRVAIVAIALAWSVCHSDVSALLTCD